MHGHVLRNAFIIIQDALQFNNATPPMLRVDDVPAGHTQLTLLGAVVASLLHLPPVSPDQALRSCACTSAFP
jgi:hypothetical protein